MPKKSTPTCLVFNVTLDMMAPINSKSNDKVVVKLLQTYICTTQQQKKISWLGMCIEWLFFCTALFLNEIYLPMKYQVSSLNTF